jgi:two-component system sensor histidine kinase KdpD
MSPRLRRLAPYCYALAGVALITALIGLVRSRYAVPDLSMVYLVLVLWLGARYGILPAALAGADDLPAVQIDELQVDRLLTNLLDNAIDFTPAGGGIELGARVEEGHLLAWVENEGPMIPAADLQLIFDKFWTGRTTGTGLGLAIARLIVERHGGTIEVRNRRTGPRFQFTLPLAVAVSRR